MSTIQYRQLPPEPMLPMDLEWLAQTCQRVAADRMVVCSSVARLVHRNLAAALKQLDADTGKGDD